MKVRVAYPYLVVGAIFAACRSDSPPTTAPLSGARASSASLGSDDAMDQAIRMRLAERAKTPQEARDDIEGGGNIVIVGFRPPGAMAGVDSKGQSRVSARMREVYADSSARGATRVIHRFKNIPAIALEFDNAGVAEALRHKPWVDYVAPNTGFVTPEFTSCGLGANEVPAPPGDPDVPQIVPWQASKIGADTVWARGITGVSSFNRDLIIFGDGVVEHNTSPSQPSGPDLYTEIINWYVPWSSLDGRHETPVVGAAAARNNGVGTIGIAPGARVRVDKILEGDSAKINYLAIAIDNEAAYSWVMNLSWGHNTTNPVAAPVWLPILDAIRNAYYTYNVIFVTSTGNLDRGDLYHFPAVFDEVVGVGGSGGTDGHVYNNWAPGNVEISAPAAAVVTVCKGGQTGTAHGTSFAAPLVAGAFMLLKQAYPTESASRLRERVRLTAKPMAGGANKVARVELAFARRSTFPQHQVP